MANTVYQEEYRIIKFELSQMCEAGSIFKSLLIYHINRQLKKNHTIMSVDTEKAFDNIQHSFMINKNKSQWTRNCRGSLNFIKNTDINLRASLILGEEKCEGFPLISRKKQGHSVSSAFCYCNKSWDNQLIKGEGLFWLTVLRVLIQIKWPRRFWAMVMQMERKSIMQTVHSEVSNSQHGGWEVNKRNRRWLGGPCPLQENSPGTWALSGGPISWRLLPLPYSTKPSTNSLTYGPLEDTCPNHSATVFQHCTKSPGRGDSRL